MYSQVSCLDRWTLGSEDLHSDSWQNCGIAVVWMSTCVSGKQPVKSCAWGDATLCWSATHMVLHIWGEGTVRSPVGLILLMPPSRIQTLGYFIFTRWAANWKNRRVTEVTPGFLQFLAFIRQGYFYSNSCYCHFCISHLSFRIHSVTYLLLKKLLYVMG